MDILALALDFAIAETLVTVGLVIGFVEWRFRAFTSCLKRIDNRIDNHLENNNNKKTDL